MYNLCGDELASMRFLAHSPQAIVKLKPLAHSVGSINLSAKAYQYLITALVLLPHAPIAAPLWDWPFLRHLKHMWIRKMIIGKVHHLLRFLTISMSYNHLSVVWLFPWDQEGTGAFLLKYLRLFSGYHWGVIVKKSMLLHMYGSEALRTQWPLNGTKNTNVFGGGGGGCVQYL